MSAALIFTTLPGRWALTRTLPGTGTITGTAMFSPSGKNRLAYREEGRLTLANGGESDVFRAYTYELAVDALLVFYNDPARQDLMHRLHLAEAKGGFAASHCHVCGLDRYALEWSWQPGPRLELAYTVTGPRKDYSLHTVLTRLPS